MADVFLLFGPEVNGKHVQADEEIRERNRRRRLVKDKAEALKRQHDDGRVPLDRGDIDALFQEIQCLRNDLHEAWSDPDFH